MAPTSNLRYKLIMYVHGYIMMSEHTANLRRLCGCRRLGRWDDVCKETWQEAFHALVRRRPYRTLAFRPLILFRWRRHKETGSVHDQQHILQRFRYSFVLHRKHQLCIIGMCFMSVLHLPMVQTYPHSSSGPTNPGLESRLCVCPRPSGSPGLQNA